MYPSSGPITSHLPDPDTDPQFYDGVTSKRAVAFIIDFIVIGFLSAFMVTAFGITTFGLGFLIAAPVAFATSIGYRITTLTLWSATIGMRVMGIELRTLRGQRFDLMHAAIHSGVFVFLFSTVIGQMASIVLMLTSKMGKGVPDLLLGSAAINRPA